MPVHVVEEASHLFAKGLSNNPERLAAAVTMGCGLLERESATAALDRALPPPGLRENAREGGVVGTLEGSRAIWAIRLLGSTDRPGQIVLKMPKLALGVTHIPEDSHVLGDHWRGCHKSQGYAMAYPFVLVRKSGVAHGCP